MLSKRLRSERGATLVEYALIVATVALAGIVGMSMFGGIKTAFESQACDEDRGRYCCAEDDPKYAANCDEAALEAKLQDRYGTP